MFLINFHPRKCFNAGVKLSLELGYLVEEEPFEVRFDENSFVDGPKKGRLRLTEGSSPCISAWQYLSSTCMSSWYSS